MLKGRIKASSSPSHGVSDISDFPSSFVDCNRRMFQRQDGCDVIVTVKGPGDASETKIGAHRYVLCCRSPFFYKSLQWGSKASAEKKLKENDIPIDVFREILRYMYCDELSLTLSNAVQVLQGARKYQLNGLSQRCLEFLEKNLTDNGVCDVLEQSLTINEQPLVDACLRRIENHTPAVFQSPRFLEVRPDVLKQIVSLETLDVSELDLFHACVAWANHRATSSPTKVNVDGAVLRRHLEPVVPLIRFPTMDTTEFATFVVPLNVLNDTETCNVYKYFTCPERPEKWFQTAKRKRPSDRRPTAEGAEGLYPEIGDVEGTKPNNVGLMPSAPDLLTGSRSEHEPPPKYEESASGMQSNDA